ncbi:MAG: VanZ family protein [Thermomicrobiales bacterium]|nr:VanZ family protein [Thermomicrobiales bacterium]
MTESKTHEPAGLALTWWIVLAPLVVMAIIFALSSRSSLPDLDGGRGMQSIAGHFTVYAALGATLALLFRSLGWRTGRVILVAIAICVLYGISDEFHQSFVPNRSVEGKDILVDFLGSIAGSVAMLWWIRSRAAASATSDADPIPPAGENS